MNARILDRTSIDGSFIARLIRRLLGYGPAQAWLAFRSRRNVDVIFSDGEHVGIPLALLLRATRARTRHVTIGHRLTSPKKRFFLSTLSAHRRMDRIALHSRQQYDFAVGLGVPQSRLALLPYQADTEFWAAHDVTEERLVLSVGLEYRDYPTLMRAARGLDAEVVIGAASNWSRHTFAFGGAPPVNVRVGAFDYEELRDMYARAAVVVVPLIDVDNQAGVTTILEAMSMGKAVVVTQSLGQTDVVQDRRSLERGLPRRRPVSLAQLLATELGIALDPNGFYVPPGDADALRRAIAYLLGHPEERRRLGRAGRHLVTSLFTVDQFAQRLGDLVRAAAGDQETTSGRPGFSYGRSHA
jgi:glycosyltransferase involved in cell wall biosynthesis